MSSRLLRIALLLGVLVAGCYAVLARGEFVYDDWIVIKGERPLEGPADVARMFREPHYPFRPYYRPVTRLTFALQKALHGDESAAPYHAVNAAIAGALAALTFLLLVARPFAAPARLAALGALVFALHPIVGSVVFPSASGRESSLPAALAIGALLAYLRPGRRATAAAWVLFGLALFAKESSVVLLPVFFLADRLLPRDPGRRGVLRYLPGVVLLGVYALVRASLFRGDDLEPGGDARLVLATPLYALQSIWAPFGHVVYEPYAFGDWLSIPRLFVALAATGGLVWLWIRQRDAVGRAGAFWLAFALVAMLPTANLLQQDAPYDLRYVLLPYLGVIGFATVTLAPLQARAPVRRWTTAAGVALVALATLVTARHARAFRTNVAFGRQWVATSPDHYLPHYNLARALEDVGELEEAAEQYRRSIELDPRFASAHVNLGSLYLRANDPARALAAFERYLALEPGLAKAHYSVGVALLLLGHDAEATAALQEALRLDPAMAEAHHNLGVLASAAGDLPAAREHFEAALRIRPDKENSRQSLREVLEAMETPSAGGDAGPP